MAYQLVPGYAYIRHLQVSEIGASSNEYTLSYASAPSREPVKFALHDPEEVAFSNSLLPIFTMYNIYSFY